MANQPEGSNGSNGPLGSIPEGSSVVSRHTAPEPKKYSPHHMGSFPPGIMYPVPRTFYLTTRPLGFSSSHREANNLRARIVLCSQIGEVMETLYCRKGAG